MNSMHRHLLLNSEEEKEAYFPDENPGIFSEAGGSVADPQNPQGCLTSAARSLRRKEAAEVINLARSGRIKGKSADEKSPAKTW